MKCSKYIYSTQECCSLLFNLDPRLSPMCLITLFPFFVMIINQIVQLHLEEIHF